MVAYCGMHCRSMYLCYRCFTAVCTVDLCIYTEKCISIDLCVVTCIYANVFITYKYTYIHKSHNQIELSHVIIKQFSLLRLTYYFVYNRFRKDYIL